jgi:hypothetical protein
VAARAESLFPGSGSTLVETWRTRQFEYTWLRTLSGSYRDFGHVTEDALVFAARSLNLELSVEKREQLLHTYLELRAWPDAAPELKSLREEGIRLAFLSNLTELMLEAAVRNSGLGGVFELRDDRSDRALNPRRSSKNSDGAIRNTAHVSNLNLRNETTMTFHFPISKREGTACEPCAPQKEIRRWARKQEASQFWSLCSRWRSTRARLLQRV